jgi:hypothetical protein
MEQKSDEGDQDITDTNTLGDSQNEDITIYYDSDKDPYEENFYKKFLITIPEDKKKSIVGVDNTEIGNVYFFVTYDSYKLDIPLYDIREQYKYIQEDSGKRIFQKEKGSERSFSKDSSQKFIPAGILYDDVNEKGFKIFEDLSKVFRGGKKRNRPSKKQKNFHFTSTQKHQYGGKKTIRHVSIKNGKGHKKVSHYNGNKLAGTVKKTLKKTEIEMIKLGKFIPGLFRDCQVSRKKGTTRYRRKKN